MKRSTSVFRWACWTLLAFGCLVSPPFARAQTSDAAKLDAVVRDAVESGRSVRVIVSFKSDDDRVRGAGTISERGGAVRRTHNDVSALTADVDAATVNALASDGGVAGISIDARVRAASTPTKAFRSSGARKVHDSLNRRGRGIAVAVIDSGVMPHQDLPASRIRAFVDFVNGRTAPYDDFGHGTHVAGIIAGTGEASLTQTPPYNGVAPSADIVALKVLDAHGAGSTSDVIAALEWVAANYRAYNIRVVNLSLGHPVYERAATDPLVRAAEALARRGILVVASAGNLGVDPRDGQVGYGGITSPANSPEVLAVGAVDTKGTEIRSDDVVTDYSSRGPTRFDLVLKPDLVAPGHHVVSLSAPGSYLFETYPSLLVTGGTETVPAYMMLSGTSMAAPVVAGTAALALEANPGLSAHAMRAILSFTAEHLANTPLLAQGAGYVNAFGAVRLAAILRSSAPLGTVWLTESSFPAASDQLYGETVSWGKELLWKRRVLLGNFAYIKMFAWKDTTPWGAQLDSMVWGACNDSQSCDDNVVWGNACDPNDPNCDNVVWGNEVCDPNDPDCDNVVWGNNVCLPTDPECDNVVWGNCVGDGCDNVVWGNTCDPNNPNCDNVVWGNECDPNDPNCDNVVWGNDTCLSNDPTCDNVVWGNMLWFGDGTPKPYWASNTVAAFWASETNWTEISASDDDNVVWGNNGDNVVWGNGCNPTTDPNCDNVVWGNSIAVLVQGAF